MADLKARKGNRSYQATMKSQQERISQADQWRRDALKRIQEAIKKGDVEAIEKASLALRVYGGRRADLGFTEKNLTYYINRGVGFVYEGWTDREGNVRESLQQIRKRKLEQRKRAQEKISQGILTGKQGDLHLWRNKLTKDIRSIEDRIQKEEQYLDVLQAELERRGS